MLMLQDLARMIRILHDYAQFSMMVQGKSSHCKILARVPSCERDIQAILYCFKVFQVKVSSLVINFQRVYLTLCILFFALRAIFVIFSSRKLRRLCYINCYAKKQNILEICG